MNDGKPHPEPIFLVPPGPDDQFVLFVASTHNSFLPF